MIVLFGAPRQVAAEGTNLSLRATGGYQGYTYQTEWLDRREHVFEEELRAALDGYLVSRTLARYHLGAALDNSTLLNGDLTSNSLALQYDGRLELMRRGTVPITVFGNRQVQNFTTAGVPAYRATSEVYGYSAGYHPYRLPSIQSQGWRQSVSSESDGVVTRMTNTDLSATVSQSANAAVARANVEWQQNTGPDEDDRREVRSGDVDVDYRVSDKVEVVARGSTRAYRTSYGGSPIDISSEDSDAVVRFKLDQRTRGAGYVQQHRNVFADSGFTGLATGGTLGRDFGKGFHAQADAGVSYDVAQYAEDIRRYTGEHLRLEASQAQSGAWGGYELMASAGSAYFTEIGEGGGLQNAGAVGGSLAKSVLSNYVRLNVGGDVRRQWDTSPVNLDYWGWGWRAGASTRPILGFTLGAQANQTVIRQISQDEGDSDRLQVWGVASHSLNREIRSSYTATVERNILDEEQSLSIGHAARVDAKVSQYFTLSGMLYQSSWSSNELPPWSWWRTEGIAAFITNKFVAEARVSYDWAGGEGTAEHGTTFVQLVLSRRFDWAF